MFTVVSDIACMHENGYTHVLSPLEVQPTPNVLPSSEYCQQALRMISVQAVLSHYRPVFKRA